MPRAFPYRPLQPRHGRDRVALEQIVARLDRRLRAITRSYGLDTWDVDDVLQSTWLQLVEHGDELGERDAVGAWLETTARRLSLRTLQRHVRECPTRARRLEQLRRSGPQRALDGEWSS